jgi:hypothetical protein
MLHLLDVGYKMIVAQNNLIAGLPKRTGLANALDDKFLVRSDSLRDPTGSVPTIKHSFGCERLKTGKQARNYCYC